MFSLHCDVVIIVKSVKELQHKLKALTLEKDTAQQALQVSWFKDGATRAIL